MSRLTCGKCPLWQWAQRSGWPDDHERKCIVDNKWHRPIERPDCADDLLALRDDINKAIAMREAEAK